MFERAQNQPPPKKLGWQGCADPKLRQIAMQERSKNRSGSSAVPYLLGAALLLVNLAIVGGARGGKTGSGGEEEEEGGRERGQMGKACDSGLRTPV